MGGVSIYKFSIHHVHICTRKKIKQQWPRETAQHLAYTDLSTRRVNTHTHGTVKGLRALEFAGRGPVLAHTQIQSHTSTVHGTRGHLNTWSR